MQENEIRSGKKTQQKLLFEYCTDIFLGLYSQRSRNILNSALAKHFILIVPVFGVSRQINAANISHETPVFIARCYACAVTSRSSTF